jgi:hypothetical protein
MESGLTGNTVTQASASPSEIDRGDRPGRHQRWTRTRVVSPEAGVAAHHDGGVPALLHVQIEDRLAGGAPPPLGYLGESAILH